MKNVLVLVLFILIGYFYWINTKPITTPIYLSPTDKISIKEKYNEFNKIYETIKEINKRSSEIKSIFISEMPILLQQGKITAKVYGEMAMDKEKKFRLKVTHRITGKEMDIGSNDTHFWFWSKRMRPSALNYAKHEDLNKTMLRTALNPSWMMESMNISEIDTKNIEIAEFKNFIAIIQPRVSATKEKVTITTLIDPVEKLVVGRYLYNQEGKLIASTEYRDFFNLFPRKIIIIWYEENVTLNWDLSKIKTNVKVDPKFWNMPETIKKINIGN